MVLLGLGVRRLEPSKVRVDHSADQLVEAERRPPSEPLVDPAGVADLAGRLRGADELERRTVPWKSYPRSSRSLARYEPPWPVILVMRAHREPGMRTQGIRASVPACST